MTGRPGYWRGRCECGNEVEKRLDNLKRPGDHSCGRCDRAAPRLTDREVRAKLASLEEEVVRVRQDLDRLTEQVGRKGPGSPTGEAITSEEGRAIWTYLEEMKAWLKHEIGARLKTLEQQTVRVEPLERQVATLLDKLANQQMPAASVSHEPAGLRQLPPPARTGQATQPGMGDAIAAGPARSPEASAPARKKVYPVRPANPLHPHFFYWVTAEGYELETNLAGTRKFLGFHDTLAQVRHAIQDYLVERSYVDEALRGLFEDSSRVGGPAIIPA